MNKAIIYLRTSTEEQNPENQLKDCEALAVRLSLINWEVIPEKQSAFKDIDREKFELIREAIKKGEIKDLIVWDLDRLFRNRKKLIEFFEFCKVYDCKIHSFRQDWFESLNKIPEPFNEIMFNFMLSIMGWLAEDDSKRKSMRVKNAVRKETGVTLSRKGNKWGRRTIVSDKNKRRAQELRKQGLSLSKIGEQMKLSKSSVFKLLADSNKEN
jgi:DNA invertase Pin-like site-specific DNA recombinase